MLQDWKTYKLKDLLLEPVRNGIYKKKEFHGEGARIVNMGELFRFPRLRDVEMKRVILESSEIPKVLLNKGDLLFARRSLTAEGAGKCSIVKEVLEPTTFESSIIRARPNTYLADSDFLYYFFYSPLGKHLVGSILRQVAVSGITGSDLVELEIPVPKLVSEQRAIASILSALDDKIELNLQMNKTLEEMAMTLYKHWFVDFGPFQDGNFVESELGLIPEGWEVKRLDEFYKNSQYGYTQSSSLEKIGPKFLRITDIQGGNVQWENVPYCISSDKDFEKYRIVKGDLFVARTGNSTGENVYILNAPKAVFASYLIRFQFDELFKSFYVAKNFRSKRFFDYVEGAKVGSAQPGISASTLGEFLLVIPPAKFLVDYFEKAFSFEERKEENLIENQTLTTLRDTLLPKLISGEVRVRDVEKQLSEVL